MALKGVNLGGWLVLERWITPSLFAESTAEDEYTFLHEDLQHAKKLKKHHKEFITEDDFKWLAANDIALVRVPVGYWIFGGDAPYIANIDRLDWVFSMARKYDLQVIVCLHGAPGSQNGEHHSGRSGQMKWYGDEDAREKTLNVLLRLAAKYAEHPKFWGLELLNEPSYKWRYRRILERFYRECQLELSTILDDTKIIFSDAFRPIQLSGTLGPTAMMDIHWYHFGAWGANFMPLSIYYVLLKWRTKLLLLLKRQQSILVGEWSGTLSQKVFDRYPTARHHQLIVEHIKHQLDAYESADAWCYWTYKHENGGVWSYRDMVEQGDI